MKILALLILFFSFSTFAVEEDGVDEDSVSSKMEEDMSNEAAVPYDEDGDKDAAAVFDEKGSFKGGKKSEIQRPNDNMYLQPALNENQPKLKKITMKGEYIFNVPPSPITKSFSVWLAPFKPLDLNGQVAGVTFDNVYGKSNNVLIGMDMEYRIFSRAGRFGLMPGVGVLVTSGNGRFKKDGTLSEEKIQFVGLPVGLMAVYRAQFWDGQVLVPYGGAGLSYFGFTEIRKDKSGLSAFKFGGAPISQFTAGLELQLDALDRETLWQLDEEYGINHIYLYGGIRQILGLSATFNFTMSTFEGGILVEY